MTDLARAPEDTPKPKFVDTYCCRADQPCAKHRAQAVVEGCRHTAHAKSPLILPGACAPCIQVYAEQVRGEARNQLRPLAKAFLDLRFKEDNDALDKCEHGYYVGQCANGMDCTESVPVILATTLRASAGETR